MFTIHIPKRAPHKEKPKSNLKISPDEKSDQSSIDKIIKEKVTLATNVAVDQAEKSIKKKIIPYTDILTKVVLAGVVTVAIFAQSTGRLRSAGSSTVYITGGHNVIHIA